MAQTKISQLPAAGALTGSEPIPIVQGGVTKQTTTQDIADLGGGGGGGSVDSVSGTASRISVGGTAADPVIDIDAAYDAAIQAALDLKANELIDPGTAKTSSFALVLTDKDSKGIVIDSATSINVTIPLNSTVAMPRGAVIMLTSIGAGVPVFVPESGAVTLNPSAGNLNFPSDPFTPVFAWQREIDEWDLWNGTAGGGGGDTLVSEGALIDSATSKATPVDADFIGLMDSAASNILKKLSWANVKATLKTYFDTLYAGIASIVTKADQTETNTGTNDAKFVTPLKLLVKNRKEATKTAGYTVAQTDDQGFLIANSASAIAFDFPSLEAGTIVTIININAGDVTWTNSGGTSFVGNLTSLPGGTLGVATFRYRSTTVVEVIGGIPSSVENLAVTGTASLKAGLSAGTIAKAGGIIHSASVAVGNITTGEDTLLSFPLAANVLSVDAMSVRLVAFITFAANANNKTSKSMSS